MGQFDTLAPEAGPRYRCGAFRLLPLLISSASCSSSPLASHDNDTNDDTRMMMMRMTNDDEEEASSSSSMASLEQVLRAAEALDADCRAALTEYDPAPCAYCHDTRRGAVRRMTTSMTRMIMDGIPPLLFTVAEEAKAEGGGVGKKRNNNNKRHIIMVVEQEVQEQEEESQSHCVY